jgi:arabinoxylan arabinofuranohydrolase
VWTTGVRTAQDDKNGVYVTRITSGDFIKVRGVDFGDGQASRFTASVASGSQGGSIELHLDNVEGPEIGSLTVSPTGGWHAWQTKTTTVSGASGKRDLYFVFRGEATGQLFNFDYWRFNKKGAKPKS